MCFFLNFPLKLFGIRIWRSLFVPKRRKRNKNAIYVIRLLFTFINIFFKYKTNNQDWFQKTWIQLWSLEENYIGLKVFRSVLSAMFSAADKWLNIQKNIKSRSVFLFYYLFATLLKGQRAIREMRKKSHLIRHQH